MSTKGLIPQWVPFPLRGDLDLRELSRDPEAWKERDRLERELGLHIAAYARGAEGRANGLCKTFRSAELSEVELNRLAEAEKQVPGVLFVAYAKPLKRQ